MENIRLIIWDLDETFWKGTISETKVEIPLKNIDLINTLTDRGIMNSICSKNDFETVKKQLVKVDLWDLFVFPKVNWDPKGKQVKQIIEQFQLRPETVLFIDDNPNNLAEVKYYNPKINTAGVDIIDQIVDDPLFSGKDDSDRSRLKQYKILEAKEVDKQNASSNEDFLRASNIQVKRCFDCNNHFDRILELINRTNQLNYTKKRLTSAELNDLLKSADCGYIEVEDNYGDYGIVGFYSLEDGVLSNYCFSCRILGLGVEQYIYAILGFPKIITQGETITQLDQSSRPDWINVKNKSEVVCENESTDSIKKLKVSLVGGCDLKSVAYYLNGNNIDLSTYFNYNYKDFIIHREHTEIIRGSFEYSDETKQSLISSLPFYDEQIFDNEFINQDIDILVYSPLIDYSLGVYESKENHLVSFVYGNGQTGIDNKNDKLSNDTIKMIYSDYLFRGIISPEKFYDNLVFLRSKLDSKTSLIVLNGSEQDIIHPNEMHRSEVHRILNKSLKKFCETSKNTYLLDVNKIISSPDDHTDCIRHYTRRVYYEIAKSIITIIEDNICNNAGEVFVLNQKKGSIDFRIMIKTFLRKAGLYKIGYKIAKRIKK